MPHSGYSSFTPKIFGPKGKRVQIILLDNRWNRGLLIPDSRSDEERTALGLSGSMGHTPNTDPTAELLGENQWVWLEQQLMLPAEVRLICSGTQIVNDTKGMQEWGNFPHERKRLFDLIGKSGAKGVVLLSGNVHYSEVCETTEGPYPLYDFTSSGMTHNSQKYAKFPNSRRVAGPYYENNFGMVSIDWNHTPSPLLSMKAIGLENNTAFEYTILLGDLG
jgi:alkaline phosphatase D